MTEFKFKLGGLLEVIEETKPKDEIVALVTLTYRDFIVTARGEVMAYTLGSGMQVHVKVAYVDAAGNPAVVDGPVQWSSSDTTIATVTRSTRDFFFCTLICSRKNKRELYDTFHSTQLQRIA